MPVASPVLAGNSRVVKCKHETKPLTNSRYISADGHLCTQMESGSISCFPFSEQARLTELGMENTRRNRSPYMPTNATYGVRCGRRDLNPGLLVGKASRFDQAEAYGRKRKARGRVGLLARQPAHPTAPHDGSFTILGQRLRYLLSLSN